MYKIGQQVLYNLTEEESAICNRAKQAPAIIVRVWGDTETSAVNLKVITDGENDLWVTSATKGGGPRQFQPEHIEYATAELKSFDMESAVANALMNILKASAAAE